MYIKSFLFYTKARVDVVAELVAFKLALLVAVTVQEAGPPVV